MQKSLIALAVLSAIAATTAQAQSSATIYGTVDYGIGNSNTVRVPTIVTKWSDFDDAPRVEAPRLSIIPGMTEESYIGFKGTDDLGNGLRAVIGLEAGFSSNENELHPKRVFENGYAPSHGNTPGMPMVVWPGEVHPGEVNVGHDYSNKDMSISQSVDPEIVDERSAEDIIRPKIEDLKQIKDSYNQSFDVINPNIKTDPLEPVPNIPENLTPDSPNLFGRKAIIGLVGSYGSVSMGIQPGAIDDVIKSVALSGGVPVDHNLDYSESRRSRYSCRYDTPTSRSGYSGTLAFSNEERVGNNGTGGSVSGGIKYAKGPLTLSLADYMARPSSYTQKGGEPDAQGKQRPYRSGARISMESRLPLSLAPGCNELGDGLNVASAGIGYDTGPAYFYGNFIYFDQPEARGYEKDTDQNMRNKTTGSAQKKFVGSDDNSKSTIYKTGVDLTVAKSPLHLVVDYSYTRSQYLSHNIARAGSVRPTVRPSIWEAKRNPAHEQHLTLGTYYKLSQRTKVYAFGLAQASHGKEITSTLQNGMTRSRSQCVVGLGIVEKF